MGSLLLKGGRVFDGENFFEADVLVREKNVQKIAPDINEIADYVFDATGMTVTAGLVDAHVHMSGISSDNFGIAADLCTLPFGVTAAADCGAIKGDKELSDSFCVKNVVFAQGFLQGNSVCFDRTKKILAAYREKAAGVKLFFDSSDSALRDEKALLQTVDFAEKHGLKITVHSSNSPIPMKRLLSLLRKGDILTHAYHGGKNNVSEDGFECIREAKARGVVIDAGLAGHIHVDFKVFGDAIKCGAIPDIISTDITKNSAYKRGGRYGLTMCMSIARHLGMTEKDVFRAVTQNPATALGKGNEWGRLREGGIADIAVLSWADEGFDMTDRQGNRIQSNEGYRNMLTVSDGEIVYRR